MLRTTYIRQLMDAAKEETNPFEKIKFQFGLMEDDVIELMRREMPPAVFNNWLEGVNASLGLKGLDQQEIH